MSDSGVLRTDVIWFQITIDDILLMEIFHLIETLYEASPDVTAKVWKLGINWNPAKVKEEIIDAEKEKEITRKQLQLILLLKKTNSTNR